MKDRTVLLVESDLDAAHRVEKILEGRSFHVVSMPDVESALMVFEYVAPDLVLVAYPTGNRASDNMPAFVRASSRPGTPVIGMFPFPYRSVANRALADGCVDIIPKPVDKLLLEDLIAQVLRDITPRGDGFTGTVRLVS